MLQRVIRGFFVILVGLCIVIWPGILPEILIKILGFVFISAGLITVIYALSTGQFSNLRGMNLLSLISAAIFIILGCFFIFKTSAFIDFINYLFGLILLIYGIVQIVNTYRFAQEGAVGMSMYVIPVLMVTLGIVFLFNILEPAKLIAILFGVALILLGLAELILDRKFIKFKKILQKSAKEDASRIESKVEDAYAEEVKSDTADDIKDSEAEEIKQEGE